jgi:hypothetical protein
MYIKNKNDFTTESSARSDLTKLTLAKVNHKRRIIILSVTLGTDKFVKMGWKK